LHEPLKDFLRQPVGQGFGAAQSWSLLDQVMAAPPPAKPSSAGARKGA
jgi:hypothetical protein